MSNRKKINIVTLGCSKNIVDSEKLLRQVQSGGYSVVHDSDDTSASTVIINTCGFIRDAKEESIDTILRFVKAREAGKIKNLYVMGCLAERYMEALKNEIPEVNRYFGVNDFTSVLHELGIKFSSRFASDRTLTGPGHYAYLKVSEGCDRTCAFCAIPIIRGKCVSRPVEDILREAQLLASKGVKELILIAQDLSYYGLDLYKTQKLPDLLEALVQLKSFEWIRLHYLYPANFPLRVLEIMRDNPTICRYIDIPVQHISDNVLSMMKRSHSKSDTLNLLYKIREMLPDAAIRTTLIAGHPGETQADYEELKSFVKEFRFNRLGVFAYSHEEDTFSWKNYKDEIPDEVKEERVSELMEIQQGISAGINQAMIGRKIKTMIDRAENDFFIGRSEYDSPEVDQEVLIPSDYKLKPGQFYNILITKATEFDLFGEPV
jgi:ribosomal protein S12 methylthiotransferase